MIHHSQTGEWYKLYRLYHIFYDMYRIFWTRTRWEKRSLAFSLVSSATWVPWEKAHGTNHCCCGMCLKTETSRKVRRIIMKIKTKKKKVFHDTKNGYSVCYCSQYRGKPRKAAGIGINQYTPPLYFVGFSIYYIICENFRHHCKKT